MKISSTQWLKPLTFKTIKIRFTPNDDEVLERIHKSYPDEVEHIHLLVKNIPKGKQGLIPVQNARATRDHYYSIILSYQSPSPELSQDEVGYTLTEIKAPASPAGHIETMLYITQIAQSFNSYQG